MSKGLNLHTGDGIIAKDPGLGILLAYGSTVPTGSGYAPGCRFIKVNGTSIGSVSYVNVGTKASASFVLEGLNGAVAVSFIYGDVIPIDAPFFVADRDYTIRSIIVRPLVAGSDVSAVTGVIKKANTTVAIASGTAMHSGTIDLKGAADANQTLTLIATPTLDSGRALGLDVTGTATDARGVISVLMIPV